MSKEMIVSCSSHETKIAILEDDLLTEIYYERGKEYTLAGSIYKGRVTRVLPGMQSAFVNIGLERDAFLYVSDFLEDQEEYDKIASTVEEKVIRMEENAPVAESTVAPVALAETEPAELNAGTENRPSAAAAPASPPESVVSERAASAGAPQPPDRGPQSDGGRQRYGRRGRRRRGNYRGFPESKYASRPPAPAAPVGPKAPATAPPEEPPPIILPGESLAKYRDRSTPEAAPSPMEHRERIEQGDEGFAEISSSDFVAAVETASEAVSDESSAETAGVEAPTIAEQVERDAGTWATVSRQVAQGEAAAEEQTKLQERVIEAAAEQRIEPAMEPSEPPVELGPSAAAVLPDSEEAEGFEPAGLESDSSDGEETIEGAEAAEIAEAQAIAEMGEAEDEAAEESLQAGEGSGGPEESELPMSASSAEAQGGGAEPGGPQQAAVREGHRNPRYQRKGRWGGRREGRPEPAARGARPRDREAPAPLIANLLKEGQEILVQIAKEPLGKKGARITSHIALPGRYLVYMPTVNHVGVSRKIASDDERQRLKRIILENSRGVPGGFIVRTAGEGHSEEDLRQDILYLSKLWAEVRAQAEQSSAPVLLHHDLNVVLRIMRDQLSEEFSAVWVDNEQEYENILGLVSKFQPALVSRVKLYTKDTPLFDELGIQAEIDKALKPKVWLKSGGYIVINQTEALVAIDVNTGKFVGKSNRLEDTIVKTNVEAIREIVRQIRLRDLGGIIVIDFIDMDEKKNRQKVMAAMEDALKHDRSPSKILAFNEFGLVAITRKRVRQSLERMLCQPCSTCSGSGLVKSVTTVCCEILSEAKKIVPQLERKQITLRVNPEIGRALKSRDNTILREIEEMTARPVVIRNDPMLHVEHFDFN